MAQKAVQVRGVYGTESCGFIPVPGEHRTATGGRSASPTHRHADGRRTFNHQGFRVKPAAARQFDVLKAEVSGHGKDKGPALIAEALNLLFEKYGKAPVA
jgi:hypothetical protein